MQLAACSTTTNLTVSRSDLNVSYLYYRLLLNLNSCIHLMGGNQSVPKVTKQDRAILESVEHAASMDGLG